MAFFFFKVLFLDFSKKKQKHICCFLFQFYKQTQKLEKKKNGDHVVFDGKGESSKLMNLATNGQTISYRCFSPFYLPIQANSPVLKAHYGESSRASNRALDSDFQAQLAIPLALSPSTVSLSFSLACYCWVYVSLSGSCVLLRPDMVTVLLGFCSTMFIVLRGLLIINA